MSSDLKSLSKSDKLKLAEKHLSKFLTEIQRHFDFSDFQILNLLEKSSVNMKKTYKDNFLKKIFTKLSKQAKKTKKTAKN